MTKLEILQRLDPLSSSLLSDAAGGRGVMEPGFAPFGAVKRAAGTAVTARISGGNLMVHLGTAAAGPGNILVIDAGDRKNVAMIGGMTVMAVHSKGIAGVVLDGLVRDAAELAEQNLPIFARGAYPVACGKGGEGDVGKPVVCGGVTVHPGDIVVADEDGVIVLPAGEAGTLISAAEKKLEQEKTRVDRIRQGDLFPQWAKDAAAAAGVDL